MLIQPTIDDIDFEELIEIGRDGDYLNEMVMKSHLRKKRISWSDQIKRTLEALGHKSTLIPAVYRIFKSFEGAPWDKQTQHDIKFQLTSVLEPLKTSRVISLFKVEIWPEYSSGRELVTVHVQETRTAEINQYHMRKW